MKVLIIGASSYLGARLYFDLREEFDVTGTYSNNQLSKKFIQLDITDNKSVKNILSEIKPNIIIHVANNASAKWCDANPARAVLLNQTATQYIVDEVNKINAKLIYISTMGAIKPSNLYGKTKLKSEQIVKQTKKGYLILRPSLILGLSPNMTNDRPFNRLLRSLEKVVPSVYDTSWKFQPTYIKHVCEVIKTCISKNIFNEDIIIAVQDLKSRFDTAKDILSPFGVQVFPKDEKDSTFEVFENNLSKLDELKLPKYSYQQMINNIIEEIKNKEKYKID